MEMDRDYSASELERISNYCNEVFSNCTLEEARGKAALHHKEAQSAWSELEARAMSMSAKLLDRNREDFIVMDGQSRLLTHPEFAVASRARALFAALEEKGEIVDFLRRVDKADGVKVFIGAESEVDALYDCSIIVSPCRSRGKTLGVLGVIGPVRMAYGRVIPIVQCATERVLRWWECRN